MAAIVRRARSEPAPEPTNAVRAPVLRRHRRHRLLQARRRATTPSPTPNAEFTIDVYPAQDPPEARVAIPGEKVSFLVVSTSPGTNDAVEISATATGAKITDMKPAQLKPGVVGD